MPRRIPRRLLVAALLALAMTVVAACGSSGNGGNGSTQSTPSQGATMTISQASGIPITSSFGRVYAKGVQDAAKRYGVKITNLGFTGEYTQQKAIDFLNSAIASKPDAIITSIYDPSAWAAPLKQAKAQGIPVVITNATDPRPAGKRDPFLFYVGEDSQLTGVQAAQAVLAKGTPKRAVCAIQFPGSVPLEQRCKGFLTAMQQAGVATEKLAISATDPTEASQTIQGYLTRHPDTGAIFSMSPLGGSADADGIAQGIQQAGAAAKVDVVYNGLSQQTLDAIKAGKALAAADQQIYLQGYLAVEWLYLYHTYGFLPSSDLATGPLMVDRNNVDAFIAGVKAGVRG
jgi:simple sugar transport system substrate-binding protein